MKRSIFAALFAPTIFFFVVMFAASYARDVARDMRELRAHTLSQSIGD